jgi:aspartyl-tRNA(Asn)/glutamyl-tRNA(Gln) amidotransferase subunit A
MTASVEDAASMLTIISQPDDRDWHSLPHLPRDFTVGLEAGVRGLRVALTTTLGYARVDPQVGRLVEAAAGTLCELGAEVELRDPGFSDPFEVFAAHWFTGAAAIYASIPPERRPLLDPGFVGIAETGARIAHMDYIAAVNRRAEIGSHMARFHRDIDVLLTPTLPLAAFEVGHVAPPAADQTNWMHWTPFSFPFNLTQQPAASIPCGFTASGLPVGLQIVAARYRDDVVLRVARAFESVHPIKRPAVGSGPADRATSTATPA